MSVTIKRHLHEWKYRGLYSKVQTTGYTEEEEGQIGLDLKIEGRDPKCTWACMAASATR